MKKTIKYMYYIFSTITICLAVYPVVDHFAETGYQQQVLGAFAIFAVLSAILGIIDNINDNEN